MNKTIIIVAGGSGGHLFPALALADKLKQKGKKILLLISSKKIDKKISDLRNYPREFFSPPSFSFKKIFPFLVKLGKSFQEANRILAKYKAEAVVGFGGYRTIPILLVSAFKKIPTLIHEQNVLPGKANKVLSKFVDKIAISFACSKKFFPAKKTIFSGNPLRQEIFTPLEKFAIQNKGNNHTIGEQPRYSLTGFDKSVSAETDLLHKEKFSILIIGGSQGAHCINITVLNALKEMSSAERNCLQITHLCGETDYSFLKEEYFQLDINCSLFAFLDKIGGAYAAADLVISRAGATAIAEITALRKPAILIPYPYAHQHQEANAKLLFSHRACLMVEEKDFSSHYLRKTILDLKHNRAKILIMEKNLQEFALKNASGNVSQKADEILAEEVVRLSRGGRT